MSRRTGSDRRGHVGQDQADAFPRRDVAAGGGAAHRVVQKYDSQLLRRPELVEPKFQARRAVSKIDEWAELLETWLRTDSHRGKRERRTAKAMFEAIRALGFRGGYGRVSAFVHRGKAEQKDVPQRSASSWGKRSSSTGAVSIC